MRSDDTVLARIYVDNYRCLSNFTLPLKRLNLLLGRNGTGKSTVLQALSCLRNFVGGPVKVNERFPDASRTRWSKQTEQTFELTVQRGAHAYVYRLVIDHADKRGPRVAKELLSLDENPLFAFVQGQVTLYRDDHSKGPTFRHDWYLSGLASVVAHEDNTSLTWFKEYLRNLIILMPDPGRMDSSALREEDVLSSRGDNFAAWYRYLSVEKQDRIYALTNQLRSVLDGFHSCRLIQAGGDTRTLQVGFSGGEEPARVIYYRFDELSEGQRVLILLYSLLLTLSDKEEGHATLVLDEPQIYVALAEVQPWLVELESAAEEQRLQAVLVSHNAQLIDYFGREAGVLFSRVSNGPARLLELPSVEDAGLKLSEILARGWE